MKPIRVFEFFSGIGSQVKALHNLNIPYISVGISEWYINAIKAYSLIHNLYNEKELERIKKELDIDYVKNFLTYYTFSNDSKTPQIKKTTDVDKLYELYYINSITKNYGDIRKIKAEQLPNEIDLVTYSFPCIDISICGKSKGFTETDQTHSSLVWEVVRILKELKILNKLPKYLLLENVISILNNKHIDNLNLLKKELTDLGYFNTEIILNAVECGIPQNRKRYFLISTLDNKKIEIKIDKKQKLQPLSNFINSKELKLWSKSDKYLDLIIKNNDYIEVDKKYNEKLSSFDQANRVTGINFKYVGTITFKGESSRHKILFKDENGDYKIGLLGGKENLLLMGFSLTDYNKIKNHFSSRVIEGLSGNSIVIQCLEQIFKNLFYE